MLDISHLKRARTRLGLTQAQFAKRCGVSQSLVAKIESGRLDPKYSTVKRIEEALAVLEAGAQQTLREIVQRKIITAPPHERAPHLIKRMQQAGISQVPVLEGKHVAGLVTESSLLAAVAEGEDLSHLTAADVMEDSPPMLPAATPLPAAAQVLEHMPLVIVMEKGAILGIVTRSDLLRSTL